ncbi:stage V sporulation protein B [Paenibacillus turicensis]|uniref:Stage V sporulation protein B n=1 Tax=Paenibacillus turicensis TaxID=160487 RepID=A0ABS4FQQ7_9BACL|nr:stage V sporulation protein B [Paenibacillus turicensis]
MNKQTFIQGAMILMVAGVINRVLGFLPRILLPRIIGDEGVGLYQLGYPFFLVIVTIISGGIPLAVAKLVAEAESQDDKQKSSTILRNSLVLTCGVGALFTILSIVFAPWVSNHILTDPRVYQTFLAMSPMIVIVAASSVYRGYFQGKQDMIPSALSSTLETIARIICGLCFSYLMLPMGLAYGAAGAMLGVVAGEAVGFAVLLWQYSKMRKREGKNISKPSLDSEESEQAQPIQQNKSQKAGFLASIKSLLTIAIPVTAGRLVGSLSYLLESITTAQALAIAGVATAVATAQYGALQGMIIPLILLPGALTASLATSLVPSLSEAKAKGDEKTIHLRLHQSLRLALLTGAPFAAIMYVIAEPLCLVIFNHADIAGMLRLIAPFAIFIYAQPPLQAALQALDQPGRALINTLIGAIIKIVLIFYLAVNPSFGIYGAVIAIAANMIIVTLLHSYSIARKIHYHVPFLDIIKIVSAMFIMGAAGKFIYEQVVSGASAVSQIVVVSGGSAIVYLILLLLLGMLDIHDIKRIPFIKKRFNH